MDLPVNSEVGLAIVTVFLVVKEFINALKKTKSVTIRPDSDIKEAISEMSKILAVQTEILRTISEAQREMYRHMLKKPSCHNYDMTQ